MLLKNNWCNDAKIAGRNDDVYIEEKLRKKRVSYLDELLPLPSSFFLL
jgi:hypothetical protein